MKTLLAEIRACTVCADNLPDGPRPGIPWDDPSGDRPREWLGLDPEQFYDPGVVALVPMGFCYPGSTSSGDKPPRPECAPLWHEPVLGSLPSERLDIIIGTYAQARYIPDREKTLTGTVENWARYLPDRVVLPHPSPRNRHWLTKNPWFETETLPAVRSRVVEVLAEP